MTPPAPSAAPKPQRRNDYEQQARPRLILEAAVSSVQDQMTAGVVLLGYALLLGADTFQVGLISTAQMIGASLQLVADRVLMRFGTRKRVGIASLATISLARVFLGLLPAATVWLTSESLPWALLLGLIAIGAAGQVGQVTRLSWIGDLFPEERRGRFLGDRQFAGLLVGSGVGVAAAWFLDWHRVYRPDLAINAAQGLFIAAGFVGVAAILALRSVPEPPPEPVARRNGLASLAEPFRDQRFRPLMAHLLLWQFSAPFAASFFNLYLISVLHMPLGVVALYTFLGRWRTCTRCACGAG